MTSEPDDEWMAAILSLLWMRWNHTDEDCVRLAFPDLADRHESYRYEKLRAWGRDCLTFFGTLDRERKQLFVAGLRERYARSAAKWLEDTPD